MTDKLKSEIFYGWVVVAAGGLIMSMIYGCQLSYGIFFTELCGDLGWTRAMVSGAYSLYMIMHGAMYLVAGGLNDRHGPRLVLMISVITMGMAYTLMSTINTPWQLYAFYGVMIGGGMSLGHLAVTSTVSRWFMKKRGTAMGITMAIAGIGILISAPFAQFLIIKFGWRTSYLILAGPLVVIAVPISRLMRLNPSEKGLLPDGVEKIAAENNLPSSITNFTFREAIKTKTFWLLFTMYSLFLFPLHMVGVHLKAYAIDFGITEMIAATIVGLRSGGSIVGNIVIGRVSDKIRKKTSFLIVYILLAAIMLWLIKARQPWQFCLFSLIFGFGFGGCLLLFPAIIGDWFGTKFHGSIYGALSTANIVGAIGPFLAGYIHDTTGSYELAFIIAAALLFIAMGLSLIIKAPQMSQVV